MMDVIANNIDVWTTAQKNKKAVGRGSGKKKEAYGIKKLRELILELAVKGKLVRQDPNDEPASELLKKISAEKEKLIKEKKIKKQKAPSSISDEEKPFELPNGWEWEKLGFLSTQITDGVHHTPNYIDNGIPFISVKDIDGKTISFENCKYISPAQHEEINQRCNPEKGDMLICRIGTLGRVTIVDTENPFSIFVSVGLIKFVQQYFIPEFTHLVLHSPLLTNQYEEIKAGGSHTNKLNLGDLPKLVLPVVPLREQHRIVDKVDELMELCDQLEQQQIDSIEAHKTLVETLLDTLTNVKSQREFTNAWNRISEHFDTLFITEHSIDQLKQTILQLAVMGKLVPQDSNDEPASSLVQRILDEQARLIKEEKLKTKAEITISGSDKYLSVPCTWGQIRLGNLAKFIDYRGKTPTKTKEGVRLITAKNVRFGYISLEPEEFITEEEYVSWMTRGFPKVGDILFTPEAPLGNVAIINIKAKFALAQRVICFQLHEPACAEFIKIMIMSEPFQKQLILLATGMTATGIKASKLKEIPVPLPPLAEQHRIVSRADELMALCDTLKNRINNMQITQLHLADAMAEQALN